MGGGGWENPEAVDYGKGLKESLLIVKTAMGLGILLGWCDNVTNGVQNSSKVGLHKPITMKIKQSPL